MSHLDRLVFFNQYFYFLFNFGVIYFLFLFLILPKLFQSIKSKEFLMDLYATSSSKSEYCLKFIIKLIEKITLKKNYKKIYPLISIK